MGLDFRIWRSPYSNFSGSETLSALNIYTDDALGRIASNGFNAIWIRGVFKEIAKSGLFPELSGDHESHAEHVNELILRAGRAGLKVFLYLQAPSSLPADDPFWEHYPDIRGATYDFFGERTSAFCLSVPVVREYLVEASEALSRSLPGLGGVILITASELIQHCHSHLDNATGVGPALIQACSRCRDVRPAEHVIGIIETLQEGFKAAGHGLPLIAWNWSWNFYEPDPQEAIIRRLPKDVILMADFERGGSKQVLGRTCPIDEYSLSYAGPSKRFTESVSVARSRGVKVAAKIQVGTTHELATVPNLPVIGTIHDKVRALRRLRIKSLLGCWNFGNMLSANTAALTYFYEMKRLPPRATALRQFARHYFGECDVERTALAWLQFEKSLDHYPFSHAFIYGGPINYALSQPILPGLLDPRAPGVSWEVQERGDDLSDTIGPFTYGEICQALDAMTQLWDTGVAHLIEGLQDAENSRRAEEELNTARIIGHCFRSTWNLYRAWGIRKDWHADKFAQLKPILLDELSHIEQALPIVRADKRLGFHSECQAYLFSAASIEEKMWLIRQKCL